MYKIIEVALTSKFGAEAVTNLMEVIGATPNPEMAAEILLGVYQQPMIPIKIISNAGVEKTLVSVDYWHGDVTYTYEEKVRQHMYVDENLDTSILTLENYKEYEKQYGDSNRKVFYLPTGETKTQKSSSSISTWLSEDVREKSV